MADKLKDIKLNEILQNWRVKDHIRKKSNEKAKKIIDGYNDKQNQIMHCHVWLLTLHYQAITRLQDRYNVSKPEFMVLMGSYLFLRKGMNGFRARELSSTLLTWQHNRVYRHLRHLSQKGYIRIEKNKHNGVQRYYITREGQTVIKAFSQHFWKVYHEVWEKIGDLPDTFDTSFNS